MGQTLVTAGATLLALVIGVLIEPAKNAFAHKARARQLRAERCEAFTTAAMTQYAQTILYARRKSGIYHPVFAFGDLESHKRNVESQILQHDTTRALVAAIKLYGPDDLADAAMGIAIVLDGQDYFPVHAGKTSHDELEAMVESFRMVFLAALDEFVLVARKHIAK